MLDQQAKAQLQSYLNRLVAPITIGFAADDSETSRQMDSLLKDFASLSNKIVVKTDDSPDVRRPSFTIARQGEMPRIRFAAMPMGHEFSSLILALLQASGYPSREDAALQDSARKLAGPLNFEIYISLSCHNCPEVVQSLNLLAVLNPQVKVDVVDGSLFPDEVKARRIMAVPTVYLNGGPFLSGRREFGEIISKLDAASVQDRAEALSAKAPFDVLVVGAGPAGAAAAVYSARKGLRTGMVAERLGGQVNETADIENFISVRKTDGTKLGADLMAHVSSYDVDVMKAERVRSVKPSEIGWTVELESGAELRSRTLIAATGARWRKLEIPGEAELTGKGVAYCPHCDGPLFRGKDVVVIGGGNSGVEAAIDLAGICRSVTLLQRGPKLTADEVLCRRLEQTANIRAVFNTRVDRMEASDGQLSAVHYEDRTSGEMRCVPAAGCFVQIGLRPNSEWVGDSVRKNEWNEIVVDAKCAASAPGFFAAGDCTSVPYKQIAIAVGEGAKAALSAFDYLIRSES